MGAILAGLLTNKSVWMMIAGVLFVSLLGIQSARLDHAKHDLDAARAALIDPATKMSWASEALSMQVSLNTDRQDITNLTASLQSQNDAMQALQAKGMADTAAAQKAATAARADAQAANANAAKILAAVSGKDGCASADALILSSIGSP